MTEIVLAAALIDEIASSLDLRGPNQEALRTIVMRLTDHDANSSARRVSFEGVADVATGVGKTYILAALIDYLAQAENVRNFAVITPGNTILRKTVNNFTEGHPKSLLPGMSVAPLVITAESFNTAAVRRAMDDESRVKLYVFTVQALTAPTSKQSKKTHKFQEGLGKVFYDHLAGLEDLVVFADEHHCYYGPKFDAAVRDLDPYALLGLTATPDKRTPSEQIIYRYPLAAAIADRLVKTPVIVGRKDERKDVVTKLRDGLTLLEAKQRAVTNYTRATGAAVINPIMLVIAKDISDAEEVTALLKEDTLFGGKYGDNAVLTIHSKAPDESLAALESVEDASSPVRVIVSVGMLKEGWDVKNVYVIVSLRSMISEILTEQTLGRGLRLPWGAYTDVEFLDTLEVIAHEKYEDLLKRASVINEAFVDTRTYSILRADASGKMVPVSETVEVHTDVITPDVSWSDDSTGPVLVELDKREADVAAAEGMAVELHPRLDFAGLAIPVVEMTAIASAFNLRDITDVAPFAALGKRFASPDDVLRRKKIGARVVVGKDGIPKTELVTGDAVDRVSSQSSTSSLEESVEGLVRAILACPVVPARAGQSQAAKRLVDAFVSALGSEAEHLLSAFPDRATESLVRLVTTEARRHMPPPQYSDVVRYKDFHPVRIAKTEVSHDLVGDFKARVGYEGWKKSLFDQAWFDSRPERDVANVLDAADDIRYWVRLHNNDLPILWSGAGSWYNPDFIAVETEEAGSTHWIVEVKADKEMPTETVKAKRQAAERWANYASDASDARATWRYVLLSESDIKAARDSWPAMRQLSGQ